MGLWGKLNTVDGFVEYEAGIAGEVRSVARCESGGWVCITLLVKSRKHG